MNSRNILLVIVLGVLMASACSNKKSQSDTIIAPRIEKPEPSGPIRMQTYSDKRDVSWIGQTYHVSVERRADDSLAMVKDETGQLFVDNRVSMSVLRSDGSVFYSRRFTKSDFYQYLDNDYIKSGILEGFVFSHADGDWLEFAASVSHPQTDEFIPLIVRLSRMGDLRISRDTQMDTSSDSQEE